MILSKIILGKIVAIALAVGWATPGFAQNNSAPVAIDDTFTQRFDAHVPSGDDFVVNSTTAGEQFVTTSSAIAALAGGGFVIVWTDNSQTGADTSEYAVRAQRFDASGAASGAEQVVNSTTSGRQSHPAIAALAGGGFVVAWIDFGENAGDTDDWAIRAQRFDASASAVGSEFLVNTTTTDRQAFPAIAGLNDGGFVIVWEDQSAGPGYQNLVVRGQRYDAAGNPAGSEFLVSAVPGGQSNPAIEALATGGFVVAWRDTSQEVDDPDENETEEDTDSEAVRARLFDASGTALGAEFLVNSTFSRSQDEPSIAAFPDGGFVIAWEDQSGTGGDNSGTAIRAQRYDASGAATGSEFLVNTTTPDAQWRPNVAAFPDGDFIILWADRSDNPGTIEGIVIRAQRFASDGTPLGDEFIVNSTMDGSHTAVTSDVFADGYFVATWAYRALPSTHEVFARLFEPAPLFADRVAALDVLANDTDPDTDALTITQINGEAIEPPASPPGIVGTLATSIVLPSGASLSLGDTGLDYDPAGTGFASLLEGQTTDDTFTYTISDGSLTDTANVTVTLAGINDAPTAMDDTVSIGEDDGATDLTADLLGNDTDPDTGETAQLVIVSIDATGTTGVVTFENGNVSYDPNGQFEALGEAEDGADQFSYTIEDPSGLQSTARVDVGIRGVDDAPTAVDDTLVFGEEEGLRSVVSHLRLNDYDVDDPSTEFEVIGVDTTGTLGLVNFYPDFYEVEYSPNGAFNHLAEGETATDVFYYTIAGFGGGSDTARVEVTIEGFDGYPLTVTTSGLGSGTVTSLPLGINCGGGGACDSLFTQNTEIALTANVGAGTAFEGWSGDCLDNSAALCAVRMDGERNVSARFVLDNPPEGRIVAATLPGARSGYLGGPPITVFMTVLSRQSTPAQACRITAPGTPPFNLSYQQIDGSGAAIGPQDPMFDLGEGGAISFVIALEQTQLTDSNGYVFLPQIECENASLTPIEGVNSVLVSIGAAPLPDIVSIGTTPTADGVVRIPDSGNRISFLSAAALNIGAGDGSAGAGQATVTASVDTGGTVLPLTLEVCETLSTGGCITPRGETSTTSVFDPNIVKFFAVFVRANEGEFIPFDPANSRVFLRFADATGAVRSVTSAAISAPELAGDIAMASLAGQWSVLVRQSNTAWPPLLRGELIVGGDGRALLAVGNNVRAVSIEPQSETQSEFLPFVLNGQEGQLNGDGRIASGDALTATEGAFWGVRDDRGAGGVPASFEAGLYDSSIHVAASGEISGMVGGCAVSGETGEGRFTSIVLSGCAEAGRYLAVFNPPANENEASELLIANEKFGWRLAGE